VIWDKKFQNGPPYHPIKYSCSFTKVWDSDRIMPEQNTGDQKWDPYYYKICIYFQILDGKQIDGDEMSGMNHRRWTVRLSGIINLDMNCRGWDIGDELPDIWIWIAPRWIVWRWIFSLWFNFLFFYFFHFFMLKLFFFLKYIIRLCSKLE
jgi:hypothetical protein